jgi:hypothetical protein
VYTASLTSDSLVLQPYSTVFTMPFLCPPIFALQKKMGLIKHIFDAIRNNRLAGMDILFDIQK